MNAIKCLIIDDEPLARKGLKEYLYDIDFLEFAGECENPLKAAAILNNQKIDLMFLDIHMPKIDGIEFLKTLKTPPITIITTAYQEYALQGYELDVLDYLLKPIPFERFLKAANKAKDFFDMKFGESFAENGKKDYFFIKCDRIYEKIYYKDIIYIQALQNYVEIYSSDKKYITHLTLKTVNSFLPKESFVRVHKSYIVATDKVSSIDGSNLKIGQLSIPIGKNHKDDALSRILHKSVLN